MLAHMLLGCRRSHRAADVADALASRGGDRGEPDLCRNAVLAGRNLRQRENEHTVSIVALVSAPSTGSGSATWPSYGPMAHCARTRSRSCWCGPRSLPWIVTRSPVTVIEMSVGSRPGMGATTMIR